MKIAHVIEGMGVGGVTSVMLDLVRLAQQDGHDVVVVAMSEADWQSRGLELGIPILSLASGIKAIRAADVVHTHQRRAGLLAVALGRGRVTVEHVHNPVDGGTHISFRGSAAVVAVSESVAAHIRRVFPKASKKLSVIPNAVAGIEPRLSPREGQPLLVVAAARLSDQKRPLEFLNFLSRIVQEGIRVNAIWYGSGPLAADFDSGARAAGLSNILRRVDFIPREELREALRDADLSVLTSAFEGLPLAAVESLSAGTPVLMTESCDLSRVITSAGAGATLPFDTQSWPEFARIHSIAGGSYRAAARKLWQEQFSDEVVWPQWRSIYSDIARRAKP